MRSSVLLPMLSLACTTHVRFDDINVEADVDDVNVPGKDDSPDDTGVETVTTTPWTEDTGDFTTTTTSGGPVSVTAVSAGCYAPTRAEIQVFGEFPFSDARLFVQETGYGSFPEWSENHPLWADGAYANVLLDDGSTLDSPISDWVPGQSTVFTCRDHIDEPDYLTWAVQVVGYDGSADCVVIGHDPEGLVDGLHDADRAGAEPDFDLSRCRAL